MKAILLAPPIAFVIYLAAALALSRLACLTAAKGKVLPGKVKAYACGEETPDNRVQPEYRQFFPFAVFFTLMHVAVLMAATVPPGSLLMPVVYLAGAAVSIFILFGR